MTKKPYIDDEGLQIADMSRLKRPWPFANSHHCEHNPSSKINNKEPLDTRLILWSAFKASLLIGLLFSGIFFLFILFCQFIWLK